MLKRINDALPGLVFGIVFAGLLCSLFGVWFVTDRISYSIEHGMQDSDSC